MVKQSSTGFTLLEVLIASAIGGIAISAAFAFASFQIRGFNHQQETQTLTASSQILLDSIIEDIRPAGLGTSFWAGSQHPAGVGGMVVSDGGGPLGLPSVMIANDLNGPAGVKPGSDALMVLRVEGDQTNLPSSGVGIVGIGAPPGVGPYLVLNQAALRPCATAATNGSHLALLSDLMRQGEPASMLVELRDQAFWATANPDGSGEVRFFNGFYAINPTSPGTPGGVMPAGRVYGPGSVMQCVRVVVYWLDTDNRVRMWQSTPGAFASASVTTAAWGPGLRINPATDAVIADAVEDLQFEAFMSGEAPNFQNGWAFNTGPLGVIPEMAEARAIRMTALMSTPRARDPGEQVGGQMGLTIADHVIPAAQLPATHTYRQVSYTAELRNLRNFDLMSSGDRDWNEVRSFPQ